MYATITKAAAAALIAAFAVGIPVSGPASAKGFRKAPVSVAPAAKLKPKKHYLSCMIQTASIQSLGLYEHKVKIRNTRGYPIPAGTRVYWSTPVRYGAKSRFSGSTILGYALPPGFAIDFKLRHNPGRCVAWYHALRTG